MHKLKDSSLVVCLCLLMAGCFDDEPLPARSLATAAELVENLSNGRFDAAYEEFDSSDEQAYSRDQLESDWESLVDEHGEYVGIDSLQAGNASDVSVVFIKLIFSNGSPTIRITMIEEQITDFALLRSSENPK